MYRLRNGSLDEGDVWRELPAAELEEGLGLDGLDDPAAAVGRLQIEDRLLTGADGVADLAAPEGVDLVADRLFVVIIGAEDVVEIVVLSAGLADWSGRHVALIRQGGGTEEEQAGCDAEQSMEAHCALPWISGDS